MKLLRIPSAVAILLLAFLAFSLSTFVPLAWAATSSLRGSMHGPDGKSDHFPYVLLLSIDGLHAQDLARYVRLNRAIRSL